MLTATILGLGDSDNLHLSDVVACIQNEEGCRNGRSASLNAIAPIKGKGNGKASSSKKEKHANYTCHYCNKKGQIKPNCQKRKKDKVDGKKKDKESGSDAKAINNHVVETTASIQEVNDISVSLCTITKSCWLIDSRATHHITPHCSDFVTYQSVKGTIHLSDKQGTVISQLGVGITAFTSLEGICITFKDTIYVPDIGNCILSLRSILDKVASIPFHLQGFDIIVNKKVVASGYHEGHLFWVNFNSGALNTHHGESTTLHTWYQHMGHMSHDALKSHGPLALQGLHLSGSDMAIPTLSHGCKTGKSTCKPFPSSSKKATQILELVHSDLAGPMQTKSLQGSYHTAIFIDDFSSHIVIYFLKTKDQFLDAFKKYINQATTQSSNKFHFLQSDRGGKYTGAKV